jgi:NitT/TauT family transport system substrate-binding protein
MIELICLEKAMPSMRRALVALLLGSIVNGARAEVSEINVAQQYGVSFLPLMVMEREKLVEKHAKALGLPELKANWVSVAGPSVMNDGVISGAIQFIAVGAPSLITLWDKTKNNVQVKGVSAMTTYPLYLMFAIRISSRSRILPTRTRSSSRR